MSRNLLMKILNNLHIADNSKALSWGAPGYDKLHKLRPLVTELNRPFQENGVPTYSQSIDEAMVLFKGRSRIRQYMQMKPTKRGYKVWVRADSKSGYVYQFEVYTGKGDSSSDGVGLGERVVKNLTESLNNTNTHVCFDNFFASVALLQYLSEQKIFATCTIRSNRWSLPLIAKQNEPMERNASKWRTQDTIGYVKWKDTKVVHVMPTAFSPSMTISVSDLVAYNMPHFEIIKILLSWLPIRY